MSLTFKGDIVHGEKYTDNNTGEDKWKNTKLGGLFYNPEKDEYVIKFLGQWVKVFPPRMKEEGYQAAKEAAQTPIDDFETDSIPF